MAWLVDHEFPGMEPVEHPGKTPGEAISAFTGQTFDDYQEGHPDAIQTVYPDVEQWRSPGWGQCITAADRYDHPAINI
jgi:hypothetical protein